MAQNAPKVLCSYEMSPSESKWITLKKIKYVDEDGIERVWESAERRTRKATGVDAVAIFAVIRSKTNAFPVSTVVIEQYRPPIGKYNFNHLSGLIDEGETAQQAALRELHEETGFMAHKVLQVSPVVVSDPGMTNANMQLVVLAVDLEDKMIKPEPKLDPGEHIVARVVELTKLVTELKDYDTKGFVIDARLSHLASGMELVQQL
ncbi:NUDIX hydrolase domain-like protein [Gymnopilus junonius]|uniref:NUDIX hydrolase domain-like protein n=1 Tax=Gymnopilus junonius TaxID=109634 RepID=A0A9P5NTQ2_GYMJU|nr:NUDIX hydrolase domain-like protein [Gymnopilus junonius]